MKLFKTLVVFSFALAVPVAFAQAQAPAQDKEKAKPECCATMGATMDHTAHQGAPTEKPAGKADDAAMACCKGEMKADAKDQAKDMKDMACCKDGKCAMTDQAKADDKAPADGGCCAKKS